MGTQGDADTKVIAADNFNHPGILGVTQAKSTQIGWHLQSNTNDVTQVKLRPHSVGALSQNVLIENTH